MGLKTAILGSTGAVGEELLSLLEQRKFPVNELKLLASSRSAGKKLTLWARLLLLRKLNRLHLRV